MATATTLLPYPTHNASVPRVIIAQRCQCGARRMVEATDHHRSRHPSTFTCAICTIRANIPCLPS